MAAHECSSSAPVVSIFIMVSKRFKVRLVWSKRPSSMLGYRSIGTFIEEHSFYKVLFAVSPLYYTRKNPKIEIIA